MPTRNVILSVGGITSTAVIIFVLIFVLVGSRQSFPTDAHLKISIEMAFNWVECGEYSSTTVGRGIRKAFPGDQEFESTVDSVDRPFRELAEASSGSVSAYCDQSFNQRTNEDSSLFYLLSFLIRLWPGASLSQLYVLATAIVSIGFALVGFAVWKWTGSVVLSVGLVLATAVWHSQMTQFLFMGNHQFGWIFLLFSGFLMVWVVSEVASGRLWRAALIALAAGLTAAFAANMRSTVLIDIPLFAMIMGIGVFTATASGSRSWWRSKKLGHAAVLVAAFAVAWFSYEQIAIAPYEAVDDGGVTNHPIAHVLVIGLAVPPSDLARDEGIIWLDSRGFEIAERYRPGSTATMQQYNDALFDYYFDLWRDRPGDMVQTYVDKAEVTGTSLRPLLRNIGATWSSPFDLIPKIWVFPLKVFPNGLFLGAIIGILMGYSFVFSVGTPVVTFMSRLLLVALLGGYFVSMAIFPVASFYVPEFPFSLIILALVFWWLMGWIGMRAMARYNVLQDGRYGKTLRFVKRSW